MANRDQAVGLKPYEQLLRERPYVAGSTIYAGDPVSLAADGQVDASVTVPLLGVAMHYATVNQTIMVADHPEQIFIAQADDAVAVTDIGSNMSLQLGSPSSTYKISRAEVDSSTLANTATLAVKVLGNAATVDETANLADNDVIVKINNHILGSSTGTTGLV